ncbi:MAG: molybdate ABC transporter permease subunit [Alphaproteobacteria bacterium]|nr:molybdate ABC transporter permease subunit [Alphaproteobacteria bacterium]
MTPLELQAVAASLVVSGRSLLFTLPIATAIAYVLARGRFPGRTALDAIVHTPLIVPPVVVGYALLIVFGLNAPLGRWLNDVFGVRFVFASAGASLATAVMTAPLMIRAVRLSLEAQDEGLNEAARTLGAGFWDRMISLHLPLAWPGVLAAAILGFAAGLGEFGAVITFVSNIPGETQTLPLAIYSALQQPDGEAAAARLAALSITLALFGLVLSEALVRYARRRT